MSPVSPSRIASGIPVTSVETQGVPRAIASRRTVGRPSRFPSAPTTHGAASTAASWTSRTNSLWGRGPSNSTRSSRPRCAIRILNSTSFSPVPTIWQVNVRPSSARMAQASIRSTKPFLDRAYVLCVGTVVLAQVFDVVFAHRDGDRRVGEFAAQVGKPNALVEDILGVGGECVGHPHEPGGEPRHRRGCGGEVRVQVGDALQANLPGEHHGLVDVPDVLTPRRLKGTPPFRKSLTH